MLKSERFKSGLKLKRLHPVRTLCSCFLLLALLASAAQAETVFVNPGTVDGNAQDFQFYTSDTDVITILWSDNKTLEYTSGAHLFFLFGQPCVSFAGVLLDAAGKPIPDTELAGESVCAAGSDLSAGGINLPEATVFSGIRLISGAFNAESGWQWTWKEDDKPVVGQAEVSGNQPPIPDAGGAYEGVAGEPITFDASDSIDPDGTITTHNWDFGDGDNFGGEVIDHTYASSGVYNVTLTVTDNEGVIQSDKTIARIGNNSLLPWADAGGPYTGQTGESVTFDGTGSSDPDGSISLYTWDFGDGSSPISGLAQPSHRYAAAGTYYVVLTVTDDTGETDDSVRTATITSGNQAPEADAGPPVEGTVGSVVTFDGSSSSDDVGIASYDWDFGDNKTGSGVNPSHTYAAAGDYTVVLTVTDGDGVKDSASTAASIDANPLPPRADAGPPAEGTTEVAVSFDGSGSTDADGNIDTYAWDFGDGNSGTGAKPSHTYAAAGNYTVTLTVTDNDTLTDTDTTQAAIGQPNSPPTADAGGPYFGAVGAIATILVFDGSTSSDPDGEIFQFDWDYGDGNTGSGLYSTHSYSAPGSYTASLTVTDNDGATDQSTATVIIGDGAKLPPSADAAGPYNGVVGVPLTVDGSNSSDPDGTIAQYDWGYGDLTTDTDVGPTPSHTYASSGAYTVILQVTDDDGLTASDNTTADIGDISRRPKADAGGQYTGQEGVAVSFDGTGSVDPDGTIAKYEWDFGDVNTGTGPTPSHTYAENGTYIVKLMVTDDSGETDTDITVIDVGIGNLPPEADAGAAVTGTVSVAITFDGTGSSDPDGTIDNYAWNFGDGGNVSGSDLATTTHTYDLPGTYLATLSVTDNDGLVSSDATLVSISAAGISTPVLTTPANGSVVSLGPAGSTTLKWRPSSDPEGGVVSYELYLCTDEDPLANCTPTEVATYGPTGHGTSLYASIVPVANSEKSNPQVFGLLGAMVCIGLAGVAWSTRRRALIWILFTFSVAAFIGCSDGSRSDFTSEVSYQVTGLDPGTTYYWAVVAEDDQGDESSSDVWSFTTR